MPNFLDSNSLCELEKIKNQSLKSRIKNELKKIEENCSSISINIDEQSKLPVLSLYDNITNLFYSITYSFDYPFRPPKIQINFENYLNFLRNNYSIYSEKLKKINKIVCCLCCSSITCADNWSPSFTTNSIIYEIRKYKNYKRNLINKIMADKIKNKYLISDIDLESWLF
jgi:ubiquitin-protein ligase